MQATKYTKAYGQLLYEVTKESSESNLSQVIQSFVQTIRKKKNVNWNKLIAQFEKTYNEKEGIIEATVIARHRMDTEEKQEVLTFLKGMYPDKQIFATDIIDERVVGGCKIKVEDRLFDFTIQNSLAALHKQLTQ